MIKQLINNIAFDEIKLSQALTRTKLVENQIQNKDLRQWLSKELEGYTFKDKYLPTYRKIRGDIVIWVELPYGRKHKFTATFPDSFGKDFLDIMNNHRIIEPISSIENLGEKAQGYIKLTPQLTEKLESFYKDQLDEWGAVVKMANREVAKIQYQHVLDQTKHKLLDTLMQLNHEFPTLINNYSMTQENSEKVQNIVTTNIYGNNNPTNIGVGEQIEQHLYNSELSDIQRKELMELGSTEIEVNKLNEIIKNNKKDKTTLVSKVMKWLGNVSASIASKGLYDNLPMDNDIIHKIIQ